MKLIALVSGGKDSILSVIQCVQLGHEIACIANLYPRDFLNSHGPAHSDEEEIDSFCFQTVGFHAVEHIAQCLKVPLRTRGISKGQSLQTGISYVPAEMLYDSMTKISSLLSLSKKSKINITTAIFPQSGASELKEKTEERVKISPIRVKKTSCSSSIVMCDEVEEMFMLLKDIKAEFPGIQGVCSGAILSNYQRIRVEGVCSRLGLISIAPLWKMSGEAVLNLVQSSHIDAILVKVATIGLHPKKHLGKVIPTNLMRQLQDQYGVHPAGEGGEYETVVLDCPLFATQRLSLVHSVQRVIVVDDNPIAPTGRLKFRTELVDKTSEEVERARSWREKNVPLSSMMIRTMAYHTLPRYLHPLEVIRRIDGQMDDILNVSEVMTRKKDKENDNIGVAIVTLSQMLQLSKEGVIPNITKLTLTKTFLSSSSFTSSEEDGTTKSGLEYEMKLLLTMTINEGNALQRPIMFIMVIAPDLKCFANLNKVYYDVLNQCGSRAAAQIETVTDNRNKKEQVLLLHTVRQGCLPSRAFVGDAKFHLPIKESCSHYHDQHHHHLALQVVYGPCCDFCTNSYPSLTSLHVQSLGHWAAPCIGPYSQAIAFDVPVNTRTNLTRNDNNNNNSVDNDGEEDDDDCYSKLRTVLLSGFIGIEPESALIVPPLGNWDDNNGDNISKLYHEQKLLSSQFITQFIYAVSNILTVLVEMLPPQPNNNDINNRHEKNSCDYNIQENYYIHYENNNNNSNAALALFGKAHERVVIVYVTNEKHIKLVRPVWCMLRKEMLRGHANPDMEIPRTCLVTSLPKEALVEIVCQVTILIE